MKKILYYLGVIMFLFGFPSSVLAQGSITVSTGSLSMTTGGSSTFRITASNAVGRVDISSSNPSVVSVSSASVWVENNSATVTVYGKSAGNAKITVTVSDAATFDSEELHNVYNINVAVNNPAPAPTPKPTTPISPITSRDNRSSNANLKKIEVEGYELSKKDDTHYILEVRNRVDKIKIAALAEDNKASIQGIGEVSLKIGENSFDIAVTAENGAVKHYYLQVNRKDNQYQFDQLADALKDSDDVVVVLKEDSILTRDSLKLIQNAKKKMEFVRLDADGKNLYSFIVDGSKLASLEEVHFNAQLVFSDIHLFDKLSGYRKGLYFQSLKQTSFPDSISLRLPVNGQFADGDRVKVYSYDQQQKKIQLLHKNLIVKEEAVEIPLGNANQYFVTQALIEVENTFSYKTVAIVEFVLLVLMIILVAIASLRHRSHKSQEVI